MVHQSTWVIIVHGSSEYMGRATTWVMTVHGPTITPCQCKQVPLEPNLIRVHGWSEYIGGQSTWVVRVHGSS